MSFEQQPKTPSYEEQAELERERTISDAELLKEGAGYAINDEGEKRLNVTDKQIEEMWKEMERSRRENQDYSVGKELTLERINRSFSNKMPIPVKVKRTSGEVEDGWLALAGYQLTDGGVSVMVAKQLEGDDRFLKKYVPLNELKEVN